MKHFNIFKTIVHRALCIVNRLSASCTANLSTTSPFWGLGGYPLRMGQKTPPYLLRKSKTVHRALCTVNRLSALCIVNRASLTLLLVMLLSMNLWGETVTYTHDFTTTISSGGDITLSTITWTASNLSNVGSYNSGNYKGIQIGTSSATGAVTLTSKNDWGAQSNTSYFGYTKVKKVYVWMNAGEAGSITATVTIGGKSATSDGTNVAKNSSATSQRNGTTKVTFTPASDGETGKIVIAVSKGTAKKGAGYLCAIQVECETAPAAKIDVTLSRNGVTETKSQQTAPYTLPTDEDDACDGWEFKGWSSSPVASTTADPTFVTQATASGTYYAVYGKTVGGGDVSNDFVKVTTAPSDWSGDYVIASGSAAMNGTLSSSKFGKTDVTITNNTITTTNSNIIWTFAAGSTSGQYSIKNNLLII